jgi:hypothetical protein
MNTILAAICAVITFMIAYLVITELSWFLYRMIYERDEE